MAVHDYDIIIVGAGISGLTAAHIIKKRNANLKIKILEGKDRVGGRTQTVPMVSSNGTDLWDLGGQWVGRCQTHIIRLLDELEIETHPQYIQGTKCQQLGESRIRTYQSNIPKLSLWSLIDLHFNMEKVDKYARELSTLDPFSHPKAAEWDSMTLATFMDKNVYTRGAREANEAAVRTMFGCEASQLSFLYYVLFINMAGGIKNLIEATDNRAQEWKVCGGAQQISEKLADIVGEDTVQLGDAVKELQQTESNVNVETASGWKATAALVILAAPPKAIEQIQITPSLSADRVDFMKRMPMGNMIKIIITYKQAFWRDKKFSGEIVSNGGLTEIKGCSRGPLCVAYDATSPNGCPALVAFMAGEPAVEWAQQPAEVRQEAVLNQFAAFFGKDIYKFLDYKEKDWNQEPFSWGAPVSYMAPGGMKHFAQSIRQPHGRLHFAGTETATSFTGYMNGAVQAGERAALEVLSKLCPAALLADDYRILRETSLIDETDGQPRTKSSKQCSHNNPKRCLTLILSLGIGVGLIFGTVYLAKSYVRNGGKSF
ncbi:hypothetical protein Btru_073507 [Bulinus truncatus]|nr:hypothetical protein Btru_073507 [Bulinus truncatus]